MNVSEILFISFVLYEFNCSISIDRKSRASQVDCSKAGPGYSTLGYIYVKGENRSTARAHLGRFLPPGCSMIFGRGNFVYVFLLTLFVLHVAKLLV